MTNAVIELNGNLTSVGDYAFAFCEKMIHAWMPYGLKTIGSAAYLGCKALQSVSIPEEVTTIGSTAFKDCTGIQSFVLGESVTSVGNYAFNGCSSLASFTSLASTPPTIQSATFDTSHYSNVNLVVPQASVSAYASATYWKNFTSVESTGTTFAVNGIYYFINDDGETATVTYKDTNYNSYSGNVTIPSRVTHNGMSYQVIDIGPRAFYKSTSLTSVTMSSYIRNLGTSAFNGCTSLSSVSFVSQVNYIGDYAFYQCSSLTSLNLDGRNISNCTIGNYAFSYSGLTTFTVPKGTYDVSSSAFNYCSSLTNIYVNSSNSYYCSQNGVLFTKDTKTLVAYPNAHGTSYTVPDGTETISLCAFRGSYILADLTMPTSLRTIESSAFFHNTHLTSVVIPEGVTYIGVNAFGLCSTLANVELPSTLTTLEYLAFNGVSSLSTLVVKATTPPTCTTSYDPYEQVTDEPFMTAHYSNVALTVPTGYKSAYQAANVWKKFTNISEADFGGDERGDVNGDGSVDISDVTALIDCLLGGGTVSDAADCNLDGDVDITDVTVLIDYLLNGNWPS